MNGKHAESAPHVVFVAPSFGTFGGMEAFVFELSRYLHERGIRTTICFKKTKTFELDETLRLQCSKSPVTTLFVRRASMDLYRAIRSADIVHGQNTSIDVSLFSVLASRPLVLTIHGWLRDRWSVRGILARISASMATRRWYNSDFVRSKWARNGETAIDAKLPIVSNLPSGVLPVEERKGFIFAARWIENKGLDVLLDAYKLAGIDRQAWPLVLLGDGPLRERIVARIRDESIHGVEVLGFVDDETRSRAVRSSRWMVTPPHTQEDLGLTPIEARHVGVPAIITRDGGLTEAGGRFALVCEPRDEHGLARLLEKAATMSLDEYRWISEQTRLELLDYLQPLSRYLEEYEGILREHGNDKAARFAATVQP